MLKLPYFVMCLHGLDILSMWMLFFSLLCATASAFQHSHLAKDLEVFVANCMNNPRSCSARVDEMRVLKLFIFFVPTMFSGILGSFVEVSTVVSSPFWSARNLLLSALLRDQSRLQSSSCFQHQFVWLPFSWRERKLTPVPFSGSVVSRQATGTLSCQSPLTRSLRTLARCTSWAAMSSQMGAGELRPKTPASGVAGFGSAWIFSDGGLLNTLLHGRNQSVARAELLAVVEALRLCKSAAQHVFISTDCMFVVNGFARGRRRKHLTHTPTCGKNSGELTTPLAPQSCSTKSGEAMPLRRRLPQDSFHHLKRAVMKLQTNWPREELCGTSFPWNTLLQPVIPTATCDLSRPGSSRST